MGWSAGDGVALKYSGTSPDTGALEFGAAATDDQAPAIPADSSASPVSSTQMALTWTTSTDSVGVEYYLNSQ